MNNDKVLSSLCLARKAGKLCTGTEQCLDAVRGKKALLTLIACDVSANTLKLITDKSSSYGVPVEKTAYSREQLGAAFGSPECACAAICDMNFVKMYASAKNKQAEVN